MKKKYLRKSIQKALTIITMLLVVLYSSINSFEINTLTICAYIGGLLVLACNTYLLVKYGKNINK